MPTTDASLALGLLATLDRAGIAFAVLHGEDRLAGTDSTSDIDIAVDRPGEDAFRLLLTAYDGPLLPVMLWESETATLNTFWALPDGSGGVQLDLLHDPAGRSLLAVRTGQLVARRMRGHTTWRLAPADELLYLTSKRWLKGDTAALSDLRRRLDQASDLSGHLDALDERGRNRLSQVTAGAEPPRGGFARGVLRSRLSRRGLRRLAHPCGVVIAIATDTGEDHLENVREQLGGVLIGTRVVGGGATGMLSAAMWSRRPLLVLRRDRRGRDLDAADIVTGMNQITMGRWRARVAD